MADDQTKPSGREEFEARIAEMRIRTGKAERERQLMLAGVGLLVAGTVLAFVAYIVSTGQDDSRDVISSVILALGGLSLSVAGATLFLRYSIGRYLRFWLLRLIYEKRDD